MSERLLQYSNSEMAVDTFFLGEKTPGDTWRSGDNAMYNVQQGLILMSVVVSYSDGERETE